MLALVNSATVNLKVWGLWWRVCWLDHILLCLFCAVGVVMGIKAKATTYKIVAPAL